METEKPWSYAEKRNYWLSVIYYCVVCRMPFDVAKAQSESHIRPKQFDSEYPWDEAEPMPESPRSDKWDELRVYYGLKKRNTN